MRKVNGTPMLNNVRYMIAYSQEDYDKVYGYLKGSEYENASLAFPTLMALVNGKVEGVLGTHKSTQAIIAGPLLIKDKGIRRATLELKLVDAYESLLINLGVKAYIFSVDRKDVKRISMLREIDLKPYTSDREKHWYMRRF